VVYVILCDALHCTVLYCHVLHCSTLPLGISPFAVNTNTNTTTNNNNVQVHPFVTLVLRKSLASRPGHFTTKKEPAVPYEQENGWSPNVVEALWRRKIMGIVP
jgi:hypothetical protein